MTIHAQTITNPGAETGNTSGWTHRFGDGFESATSAVGMSPSTPHSGSRLFAALNGFASSSEWDQDITVDSGLEAAIDAGTAAVKFTGYHEHLAESGHLYVKFYDGSMVLLETVSGSATAPTTWTQDILYSRIPADTRTIRFGTISFTSGFGSNSFWDDFTLDISDNADADWFEFFAPHAEQLGVYSLATFPTAQARGLQLPIAVLGAAETSSGFHDVTTYQAGAYALVRGKIDRRDLRAWTFTQDDHDFWVLQLGDVGTLVYDKLSGMWSQWRSPGFVYWRGNDGVQWEGWNICCDTESGILWEIDAEGRLDNATTPITSVMTGGMSTRMRKVLQNFMAELTISEGEPPTGFDDGSVGITLRTSDDAGFNFVDHGEIAGGAIGEDMTVRWYGLGTVPAAGRIYELTDTGYARRIDGFNVEVSDA